MDKFQRITPPKSAEEIRMKQMSSTLAHVVYVNTMYTDMECPACEVGKPIDEVLEVYVN